MSAGRSHRRAGARWRAERTWAEAAGAPARSLGRLGPHEVMVKGPALVLVAAIPPGAPPELVKALERRREAMLNGRCACGARWHLGQPRPGYSTGAMVHEDACPAHDVAIAALADRLGWRWSA